MFFVAATDSISAQPAPRSGLNLCARPVTDRPPAVTGSVSVTSLPRLPAVPPVALGASPFPTQTGAETHQRPRPRHAVPPDVQG